MNPNPESPLADFLGRTVASVPQQDAGRPVHVHFHLGDPERAAGKASEPTTVRAVRNRFDWVVLIACTVLSFTGGAILGGNAESGRAERLASADAGARASLAQPPPPRGPQPGADLPVPGPSPMQQLRQQLGQGPVVLPPSVPPGTAPLIQAATPRPPTVPAAAAPGPARPARDGFGLER